MDIERVGSRPSVEGPEDWFTGDVRVTLSATMDAVFGRSSLTHTPLRP